MKKGVSFKYIDIIKDMYIDIIKDMCNGVVTNIKTSLKFVMAQ